MKTQNGNDVLPTDMIVVSQNFPGCLAISRWFVAVHHFVAAYDSPYDPIEWLPLGATRADAEIVAARIRQTTGAR